MHCLIKIVKEKYGFSCSSYWCEFHQETFCEYKKKKKRRQTLRLERKWSETSD